MKLPPVLLLSLAMAGTACAANWPSWRGPAQNQVSPDKGFPVAWKWSPEGSSNIVWRTELPEAGNSSPIVWGDRIFVTQPLDDGKKRTLMCFDRRNGKLLWQQGVDYELADTHHEANTHCAGSPTTDGERIICNFASAGIVAYDFSGKQLWKTDLGLQKHNWGSGSSPVIHGDLVIVYHGPGKDSALYGLDKKTGAKKWSTPLPEDQPIERFDGFAGNTNGMIGSFATPLVLGHGGRDDIILPVSGKLRAFAPTSGESSWTIDGMNPLVYASASYGQDRIVAYGGYFGAAIVAKPDGHGDVTSSHRVYYEKRAKRHRIGSPIIKDGYVYFSNTIGLAECVELESGKTVWEERLPSSKTVGETWGSMVLAEDRLYVINQSGDTFVLKASPKYELLSSNPVGELSNSTPAFADGDIFLRTQKALYRVARTVPVTQ
ncbi:MAG TPA: PQQ-binding-like beta-propeller repeat protein [Candidatus Limnocylindria bacterium]|jgi:outer membrane protein assembly factor BamB|nr:PQQ-binding-like beta-propeller repeat protein [Candidatus Limnocylindria bacterium]